MRLNIPNIEGASGIIAINEWNEWLNKKNDGLPRILSPQFMYLSLTLLSINQLLTNYFLLSHWTKIQNQYLLQTMQRLLHQSLS